MTAWLQASTLALPNNGSDSGMTSPGLWPVVQGGNAAAHEGGATGSPTCGGCRWAARQPEAWVRADPQVTVRAPGCRFASGCTWPRPGLTSVSGVDCELGSLLEECSSLSAISQDSFPAPPGGGGCPYVQGLGRRWRRASPPPPTIAQAAPGMRTSTI